jgi:hypothetical protein
MNKLKCCECRYFDPRTKTRGGRTIPLFYGWCAAQSEYPAKDTTDHIAPEGVKRVTDGPAKPVLVRGDSVIEHCTKAVAK